MSLYENLKNTVPDPMHDISTHYSDIYVLKTPETTKVINDYYKSIGTRFQADTFTDQITGRIFYDIPFGYMNEYVENEKHHHKGVTK